jgi:hypothetical protein
LLAFGIHIAAPGEEHPFYRHHLTQLKSIEIPVQLVEVEPFTFEITKPGLCWSLIPTSSIEMAI